MHYIVFDLEFNQDISSLQHSDIKRFQCPFEIIQIGAIKLDLDFNTVDTFNRYVKPTIYSKLNSFITDMTGITTEKLLVEEPFPNIYNNYTEFINEPDSIFCIWGMSDLSVLFKNVEYHKLNNKLLPRMFINLQPYVSKYLNLPTKNLLQLRHTVEELNIPITYKFHNALYDAYYTAEIFKKIHNSSIQPKLYDHSYVKIRIKQKKLEIDFDKLIHQFEKMYDRKMSIEEQDIIKLAYKMGKTNQFLK